MIMVELTWKLSVEIPSIKLFF